MTCVALVFPHVLGTEPLQFYAALLPGPVFSGLQRLGSGHGTHLTRVFSPALLPPVGAVCPYSGVTLELEAVLLMPA